MTKTKKDIVKEIVQGYSQYSTDEVTEVIDAFMEVVQDTVSSGDKISILKFGSFEMNERAAREGRNPQTGESMKIAACKVPKFKPAAAFKDRVNGR